MLLLSGQHMGNVHIEQREGRDGTKYPERWQIQVLVKEEMDNGDVAMNLHHLGTTCADQAKAFSAFSGRQLMVPVRAYVSGRAVAYAIQPDARPTAAIGSNPS